MFSAKMDKSYYISNMLSPEAIVSGNRRYELLVTILLLVSKSVFANHPSSHGHHHGMRSNDNTILFFKLTINFFIPSYKITTNILFYINMKECITTCTIIIHLITNQPLCLRPPHRHLWVKPTYTNTHIPYLERGHMSK